MRKILFTFFCFAIILTGYSQNDKATIKAGALALEANIPPNPVAGTICWTGTEFLGFNGARWIPLNGTEADASNVPIRIWSYLFQFPKEFSLISENNDADSYTGTIEGTGISLDFEHSYDNDVILTAVPEGDIVTNNNIDGHSIEIIQPSDLNDFTKITIYKTIPEEVIQVIDTNGVFIFIDEIVIPERDSKLTISTNNITRAQQEMLINVFNGVEIVEPSVPIRIGRYQFQFPLGFSLVPGQGIDSYIGNINGAGISLSFDYGAYTGPSSNLPPFEYEVIEDEIEGNFRQIVKPVDSQNNFTKIYMYSYSAALDDPSFHARLTLRVKNITPAEQEMIVNVFNAVEIVD